MFSKLPINLRLIVSKDECEAAKVPYLNRPFHGAEVSVIPFFSSTEPVSYRRQTATSFLSSFFANERVLLN